MNGDTRPLMVTIWCTAYNHEPYIRQCLEGFVMQTTEFRYEAIVHDDASTDETAVIIKEYAEKYPDIIKPIYEKENQYSKHDGFIERIMNEHTHGKYVALCEGDDYWTDPLKLQKQVDFMESHPDYSMCFHNAQLLNETSLNSNLINVEDRDYDIDEMFLNWIAPTASFFVKRDVIRNLPVDKRIINGDINITLNSFNYGKVRGFSDKMSVYRIIENGITLSRERNNYLELQKRYVNHFKALKEFYPKISLSAFRKRLAFVYKNISIFYFKKMDVKNGIIVFLRALYVKLLGMLNF